jgi:hypothetical protein
MHRLKPPRKAEARSKNRVRTVQVLLIFLALQGVLELVVSLGTSSMGRRALLLGYSLPRLIVSGGILLLIMVLAYGGARGFLDGACRVRPIFLPCLVVDIPGG